MKISVIIPAYNEEHYLGACLVSLQKQTRPADEVIVVDNNSTDTTAAIADAYGATVIAETLQGIWPAAYRGYCTATGDIIARCDADSVLPEDWVERIEMHFTRDTNLVAVTGPGKFHDTTKIIATLADIFYMKAYFILVGLALANWPLFGSNFVISKQQWNKIKNKVHHKRVDIHDDIDLSMHLQPNAKIMYDPGLLVGISARPLWQYKTLLKRYAAGFRSLFIHWPLQAPWNRWRNKLGLNKKEPHDTALL